LAGVTIGRSAADGTFFTGFTVTISLRISTAVQIGLLLAGLAKAQSPITVPVQAGMDIYRAGGYDDGSDGIAPAIFSFPARALQTLAFSSVGGTWACGRSGAEYSPDGTSTSPCYPNANIANPVGPFSGYSLTDFTGAMAGVFLEDTFPDSAPPPLRFYAVNSSLGGIRTNFPTLSPEIGQVFFIGDGLTDTGGGAVQVFKVPATATHLYFGYVESCSASGDAPPGCYSNNVGSLTAMFTLQEHVLDWVELQPSPVPSARCCLGMAFDAATLSTVLFGGGNGVVKPTVTYGDTWIWRKGWFKQSPVTSPSARQGPGMAYDPTTDTVVLFGGGDTNGNALADTWTWNGVTWTQQFPPVSPPAREWDIQGMAYDAAAGKVLLFGGLNDEGGVLGDTWEWDGIAQTWTQQFPVSSPSARRGTLASDGARGEIVLFGGDNGAGDCCNVYFDDTWTWNGITWTQQFPASAPSARTDHSMAYDANIGAVVLFGGFSVPGQGLNDTWTWNGSTWTQRQTSTEPGGRWAAGLDFDPSNGLVLFGGEVTGDPFTNETWLFTAVPVRQR
jgi:hypothetical protein